MDADTITRMIAESIDRAIADVSDALTLSPDFAAEAYCVLRPYIRPCAQVMAASLAAGETAEQFEERLAALEVPRDAGTVECCGYVCATATPEGEQCCPSSRDC